MRKLNSYENSRAQFARAAKVIPSGIYGHQGPAEGCYIPIEAFPLYSDHAQGSYFWDVEACIFESQGASVFYRRTGNLPGEDACL